MRGRGRVSPAVVAVVVVVVVTAAAVASVQVPAGEYRLASLAVNSEISSGLLFSSPFVDVKVERPLLNDEFSEPIYLTARKYLLKGAIHVASNKLHNSIDLSEHIIVDVYNRDNVLVDSIRTKRASDEIGYQNDLTVYEYTMWSDLGENFIVVPRHSSNSEEKKILFYPRQSLMSVTTDGCQADIPTIVGRIGLYLEGSVSPPISGVNIRIIATESKYAPSHRGDLAMVMETGEDGSFVAGPLYDDTTYTIEASKDKFRLVGRKLLKSSDPIFDFPSPPFASTPPPNASKPKSEPKEPSPRMPPPNPPNLSKPESEPEDWWKKDYIWSIVGAVIAILSIIPCFYKIYQWCWKRRTRIRITETLPVQDNEPTGTEGQLEVALPVQVPPPAAMAMGTEDGSKLDLFLSIRLDKGTAENVLVNPKVTANLNAVIQEANVPDGCSKTVGNLLYSVATKHPENALVHRQFLLGYIVSAKIKNSAQLDVAFAFLSNVGPESFSEKDFEEACGIGVEVSPDEIHFTVDDVLEENMDAILDQRYHINVGNLCGQVRKQSPWADAKFVKEVIDNKLRGILGERTAEDARIECGIRCP